MSDLPWAAMLKLAGVKISEVAERAGVSPCYVSRQLHGSKPLQYPVERACKQLVGERRENWYPAAVALIQLLHHWTVENQVREVVQEDSKRGGRGAVRIQTE